MLCVQYAILILNMTVFVTMPASLAAFKLSSQKKRSRVAPTFQHFQHCHTFSLAAPSLPQLHSFKMTISTSLTRFLLLVSLLALGVCSYPIRGSKKAQDTESTHHRYLQKTKDTSAPSTYDSMVPSGSPSFTSSEVPTIDFADGLVDGTAIPTDAPTKSPKRSKGADDEEGEFARPEDYDNTDP